VRTERRRKERSRDHYYWLTAFLAARGAQTRTCRVVAAFIAFCGAIPLALAFGSDSAHGTWEEWVAVVGAVAAFVMAASWLRGRWPSRIASELCVVVGSVYTAIATLLQGDPVVGLLGSTAFTIVGGFIALFHSMRLLMFMWLVGGATILVLAVRIAETYPALAVCGALLVALVNAFVVFACRTLLRSINSELMFEDVEPLTSLLTRDAFAEKVATLMSSRGRGDDRYLMVAVVNLDSFSLLQDMAGVTVANRARVHVGQRLRETVRSVAVLAHVAEPEFLIADVLTRDDPSPFVERVRATIASSPNRLTASIGVVSTPLSPLAGHPPYDVLDEVLDIATAAMQEARRSGGNKVHQVLSPPLTVLDRPAGGFWSDEESA
jgi:GGDEF domain-containing protein